MTAPEPHDPVVQALDEMLAAVDPVPAELVEGGRVAFSWRTMDEELLALAAGPSGAGVGAGVRADAGGDDGDGDGDGAGLRFTAGGTSLDVDVAVEAGVATVVGQVLPPGAGTLVVEWVDGSTTAEIDERGRVVADGVPAGRPVRLRVERPGAAPVVTDWLRL